MSKGSTIKSRDHGTHISVGLRVSLLEQGDEAKENANREKQSAARLRAQMADWIYGNSEVVMQ